MGSVRESSRAYRTDGVSEWKAGGPMLGAAVICYCFAVFPVNILGPLIIPVQRELGWSRAVITSAVLITAVGTVCVGPFVGRIADRVGPRRIALISLPALSVAVTLIGLSGPSAWSWYAYWSIFAMVQVCAGIIIWTQAVVSRFDRNRGMALAIVLSGSALAYGLLPKFALWILSLWSWRAVYFILASSTLLIGWPLAWQYFYGARDLERQAAGPEEKPDNLPPSPPVQAALVLQALRTRQFWQMALSFFIVASAAAALNVHFLPILVDVGFSIHEAATVAVVLGPAAILGRLGAGYFLDRFPANRVVAVAVSFPAMSYALLIFDGRSSFAVSMCALLLGVVLGAEGDFMAYLASRYFGRQIFGSLYGLLLGIFAMGYGIGPFVTAIVFDKTKSYESSFVVFSWAALGGAVLIAKLGPATHT